MGFSRKTIKGTTPLDIKNLNDNLSYLWKKVFGGIGYDDLQSGSIGKKHLRPDLSKGIDDISDRAKYTEELAKQINIQLENTINDVEYYKQENDNKVSELENDLNTTINNVDNIINDLDILNTDYGTFKIDTGTMLASKVSNEDFNSYKIQTADLIASKVDSSTYNSFVTQTNSAIASKVSSQDFNSYVLQTDKNIGSKVSSVEFETYKTQTAQLIASKVSSSDFATYRTQTDKWIADIIVENGEIKSSITANANNISLLSDLVNINGTFFDSNGLYTGKIKANQIDVSGGKIKANQIEVSELYVGDGGIRLDSSASLSWKQITSKPTIPNSAEDIGAIPDTYINRSGIWTGKVYAQNITGGYIDSEHIDVDEISTQITKVSRFINFDYSWYINGIGTMQSGTGYSGYLGLVSQQGIYASTDNFYLPSGRVATREWVLDQIFDGVDLSDIENDIDDLKDDVYYIEKDIRNLLERVAILEALM